MNGARGLLIATAAAFIVGCSVGLMGGILLMRFGPGHPGRDWRGGPRSERRAGPGPSERMLPMMERELDLTPDQRARIVEKIDQARREHGAVRESMRVWIGRELTPEQRERWQRLEEKFERARHGRRSRDRRGPDHP